MIPKKVTYGIMGGGAVGAVQSIGLRKLDENMVSAYTSSLATNISTPPPFLASQLGNFGSPSVLLDLATGVTSIGIAYYNNTRGKMDDVVNSVLFGYGATTLVGGIMNGIFPTMAWSSMVNNLKKSSSSSSSGSYSVPTASVSLVRTSGSGTAL